MKPPYTLEELDTTDTRAVAAAAAAIHAEIFPREDGGFIRRHFEEVAEMFEGQLPGYRAMDTFYHDLEHTQQATLCWIRLIANRQRVGAEPPMAPRDFEIGLVAMLLHDVGYLKREDDEEGTGAKFTFVHEQRSCEFAYRYLRGKGWPVEDIFAVQHLISCTGPRSIIEAIPFTSEIERVMGEAVCTADYFGQMSDPGYVGKLPVLYKEFEESDNYRGIPRGERLFKSFEELIRGTPFFYHKLVIPRLEGECHGLFNYLAEPYPDGVNPYKAKIEENIAQVEAIIAAGRIEAIAS